MTRAVCLTEFNRTRSNPRHDVLLDPVKCQKFKQNPRARPVLKYLLLAFLDPPRGILPGKFDIWKMAGEAAVAVTVAGRSGAVGLIWALELPDCLLALA